MGHAEECRNTLAEELEKVGDERLERENERLLEYFVGEEQNEKTAASASG